MNKPSLQPLPRYVDPRKFAHQGIAIQGYVSLSSLARLERELASSTGQLHVHLQFLVDDQRHRLIQGSVQGEVLANCQRCLEPMALPIDLSINLAIVRTEDEAKQLARDLDPLVVPEDKVDLFEVIEEDVLLGLPMVAFHQSPCVEQMSFGPVVGTKPSETGQNELQQRANPFEVLGKLLRNNEDS